MTEEKFKDYTPKTDVELEQIAQDWAASRIFTNIDLEHYGASDMVHSVFMPMVFVDHAYIEWMKSQQISFLYEEVSKAGPRSVNGFPSFMSMQMLNFDDSNKVITKRNEIVKFLQERLGVTDPKTDPWPT